MQIQLCNYIKCCMGWCILCALPHMTVAINDIYAECIGHVHAYVTANGTDCVSYFYCNGMESYAGVCLNGTAFDVAKGECVQRVMLVCVPTQTHHNNNNNALVHMTGTRQSVVVSDVLYADDEHVIDDGKGDNDDVDGDVDVDVDAVENVDDADVVMQSVDGYVTDWAITTKTTTTTSISASTSSTTNIDGKKFVNKRRIPTTTTTVQQPTTIEVAAAAATTNTTPLTTLTADVINVSHGDDNIARTALPTKPTTPITTTTATATPTTATTIPTTTITTATPPPTPKAEKILTTAAALLLSQALPPDDVGLAPMPTTSTMAITTTATAAAPEITTPAPAITTITTALALAPAKATEQQPKHNINDDDDVVPATARTPTGVVDLPEMLCAALYLHHTGGGDGGGGGGGDGGSDNTPNTDTNSIASELHYLPSAQQSCSAAYYACYKGVALSLSCDDGTYFNAKSSRCESMASVNCTAVPTHAKNEYRCTMGVYEYQPNAEYCDCYQFCFSGISLIYHCPIGQTWHYVRGMCVPAAESYCFTPA